MLEPGRRIWRPASPAPICKPDQKGTRMTHSGNYGALPDPDRQAEFYADVPMKRALAWVVDMILTALLTLVVLPFTAFTGLFFLPGLYLTLGFVYRALTLAGGSATWGMRLMSLEFRTLHGERFDFGTALVHTAGYTASVMTGVAQLVSVGLMLTGRRAQGLTDLVLGTVAINRAGRN